MFRKGINMKKLISAIISIVLLLSLATPCFAAHSRGGYYKKNTTTAFYSIDGFSIAEDVRLAAEGCLGTESKGANVKTVKQLTRDQEVSVSYWNYFTNYGYIISGGRESGPNEDGKYHAVRKYVYSK